MKKSITLLIIGLLFISFGLQAQWKGFTSETPEAPQVTITESNSEFIDISISLSNIKLSDVTFKDKTFQRLVLAEGQSSHEVGRPELPVINEIIGLGNYEEASVEIIETESIILENILVYPFQEPEKDIKDGKASGFSFDENFYSSGRSFPQEQAYMDAPGIMRGVRISGLHIIPFKYKTAKKDLTVFTSMKIRIHFHGKAKVSAMELNPMMYDLFESKLLNFEDLSFSRDYRDDNSIKYLIITNEEAVDHLSDFAEWKYRQGFRTEIRTLENGFNTPEEFKDYIAGLYESDGLEYVLMVGDAYPNGGSGGGDNIVPMYYWAPSGEDASYSDTWYVCLDGPDDHYADLAIGRFVYDNLDELDLQLQKTMDHYLAPDVSSNWAENSILVAHKENYPSKYTECKESIRTFDYGLQTPLFTTAYGGAGATNNDIVNFINTTSCGIFNYRGHGSATEFWEWCNQGSFTSSHIDQLTNEDRLFVLFDVCCDNMDIVAHAGNCLCESFMKSPVASVAINGAIIPSYTIPNHDYDKEMYKAVFHEGIYNIGYVTNFANLTVLNNHGDIGRSNVRTYLWLGDASLEPWTMQAQELSVSHDSQLFLGFDEFTVSVSGSAGPMANARVCVSNEEGSIYGVAITDESGVALIQFDNPIQNPGQATVTVTAHNYLPYSQQIPVIPMEGAYVVKEQVEINDASGNNNGQMDYNESLSLNVTLKNVGLETATSVSASLSSDDIYVNITQGEAFFGDIPAEDMITVDDAFSIEVSADIPDGHYVVFEINATDGESNWVSGFSLQGHAPVLEMGEYIINDAGGNGKLDPGETAEVLIPVSNTGSAAAFDVNGLLNSEDDYISIQSANQAYGTLEAGIEEIRSYQLTADAACPTGHYADFEFTMTAEAGISALDNFNIVVGQIPVVIIDLDDSPTSGPVMQECIEAAGVACDYVTSIPEDLSLYSSAFVCLGIYSNNHKLVASEGQQLADFLNQGGMLYMEGGDTWAFDDATAVHAMFGINGTSDGSGDMGPVEGNVSTFTEGMNFSYSGENNYMDHLSPLDQAYTIFSNTSPQYDCGIANDAEGYKTIGCSFEFGGLDDAGSPSTRQELMEAYLEFFGLMPPEILANFTADNTIICAKDSIQYTDLSLGNITSWEWTFEGGEPATSNEANPLIQYTTSGSFDVSLLVSDGEINHEITREGYITVNALPEGLLSGDQEICFGDSATLNIELSGQAPWLITINDETMEALESPFLFKVSPESNTDYIPGMITDANGCQAEGQGMASVSVHELPTASMNDLYDICPEDSALMNVELSGTAPWTIHFDDSHGEMHTISDIMEASYSAWMHTADSIAYELVDVEDGNTCYNEAAGSCIINVLPLSGIPIEATGPDTVDTYYHSTSSFNVEAPMYSDIVEWMMEPETAGSMEAMTNAVEITWDSEFNGIAHIYSRGANSCGASEWSGAKECYVFSSLGIDESTMRFSIYPNPAKDVINIEFIDRGQENLSIEFLNATGSSIIKKKISSSIDNSLYQIKLPEGLSEGLYFIRIRTDRASLMKKLIIEK